MARGAQPRTSDARGRRRLRSVRDARAELREALAAAPRPVGLVPTMGWLHDGHRALMQRARERERDGRRVRSSSTRASSTRRPTTRSTRATRRATSRSCEAEGVDLVFAPAVEEIYPPGFDTTVSVGAVAQPLEGAARPGHFDGVATVVAILFDLVGAERAYFGQKDAQQVMVIRQMARDLAIGTEVVACPTVREPDGLALSSRNVHLSPAERAAAPVLRRALLAARDAWRAGERSADALRGHDARGAGRGAARGRRSTCRSPTACTLAELDRVDGPALASLAVRFGTTRLIDNELLDPATGTAGQAPV